MNTAEIVATLIETALASSAAIVLVLLLRRPLRMRFGATVAYAGWLLVPAALLAVSLPAPIEPATAAALTAHAAATLQVTPIDGAGSFDWMALAAWAWLIGGTVAAIGFGIQQRRFRRALGALRTRADGLQQADSSHGLPAALGLLRPRIVVPADFDHRYSAEQQALVRAHERSHIRAGDLHVNAVATALRCLLWFNPLLHLVARHFRHDQELACDQRVIARHPHSRRAYGEAMFKTQLATQALPLACHWGCGHPLKERIEMLKQPVPGTSRWVAGRAAVAVLTLVVGFTAWAAQPAQPEQVPAPTSSAAMPSPPAAPVAPSPPPAPPAPPSPSVVQAPEAPSPPLPPPPPPAFDAPSPPAAPPAPPLPPPPYPAAAVTQRISGTVVLIIDIDPRGKPADIMVERSEPAGVFDQAAVEAARGWRFTPEVENGQPVASRVRVPLEFRIPAGKAAAVEPAGVAMVAPAQR